MHPKLDTFYSSKPEPIQGCLLTLRDIILNYSPHISETVKYGMPCFCLYGKMFCYLWTDKKSNEPYILIVEGNRIEHPSLIKGNRARMKIFPIMSNEDIPLTVINEVFDMAAVFYEKDAQ